MSMLPAGLVTLHGVDNFMEVERQAERIYTMPEDRVLVLTTDSHLTPDSIWVRPTLREPFLKLTAALSEHGRKLLIDAVRQPFDHTYVMNMLFRAVKSNTVAELVEAVARFDRLNPQATTAQLMGNLMYRGHSFAGIEWADRYQPELIEAAKQMTGTDEEVLLQACKWTNQFYNEHAIYGPTFTLRDSLVNNKLDCIRATDMIGAIFRNSGRTRFGHVRCCTESYAHSVAAYLSVEGNHPKTFVADGLNPKDKIETYPDAYFHGHEWPPGMEDNPTPYSVELYARGLDNYIWAEGYVIRGPNAGTHSSAAIPYLRYREKASTRKIFDGPYPD
jgi:hypothetical protein